MIFHNLRHFCKSNSECLRKTNRRFASTAVTRRITPINAFCRARSGTYGVESKILILCFQKNRVARAPFGVRARKFTGVHCAHAATKSIELRHAPNRAAEHGRTTFLVRICVDCAGAGIYRQTCTLLTMTGRAR
jgi:hypothetical protein